MEWTFPLTKTFNAVPNSKPVVAERSIALKVVSESQMDMILDFSVQRGIPFRVKCETPHYPKFLVVPIADQLTRDHMIRVYDTSSYPVRDSEPYGILEISDSSEVVKPTKDYGFWAMNQTTYESVCRSIRRAGEDPEIVLRGATYVK